MYQLVPGEVLVLPADPSTTAVIIGVASLAISGLGGFWKFINWLRDKFNEVEDHVEGIMTKHEDKDQRRHEDNIQRFAVVETQLNTIIRNGNH